MKSIYQTALGDKFESLHPQIQRRLSLCSSQNRAVIGRGVMEEIWRGSWFTRPFLKIGTWRNILFPDTGHGIPFTLENYAYRDCYGRETITWIRNFHFPDRNRRFDATMIFSANRKRIIDYLGTHQHLAVDIDIDVDAATGGFRLRSGRQRFYAGRLGFHFPMLFSGYAAVCEWFDDADQQFKIEVVVTNPIWGKLFGYRGSFSIDYICPKYIPPHVLPVRAEKRE